jgi:hypothetical protein
MSLAICDRRYVFVKAAILCWALAATSFAAEVELTDQVRDNFGIATATATRSQAVQVWQATAQVLDGASLAALVADLRAAQAASVASTSELQRVETLQQADNASQKTLENARMQAVADRSKVQSLRAQLLGSWGTSVVRLSDAALQELTQRILAGTAVLARAEAVGNASLNKVDAVRVKLPDSSNAFSGKLLGAMPQRSEQPIGGAWLLRVDMSAEQAWQPGQVLAVELQDAQKKVSGISVPRAAVVRWQGQQWVYVQTSANHYERKAVQVVQWLAQAALVTGAINADDKVVTVGAGLLLGAELNPVKEQDAAESGHE